MSPLHTLGYLLTPSRPHDLIARQLDDLVRALHTPASLTGRLTAARCYSVLSRRARMHRPLGLHGSWGAPRNPAVLPPLPYATCCTNLRTPAAVRLFIVYDCPSLCVS